MGNAIVGQFVSKLGPYYPFLLQPYSGVYTSTLLQDGRVLLNGAFLNGVEFRMAVPTSMLLDPDANSWSKLSSPPFTDYEHKGSRATLLPDGRVLVTGPQTIATPFF